MLPVLISCDHILHVSSPRRQVSSLGSGQDHVMDAISQLEQMSCDAGHEGCDGREEEGADWRLYLRKEIFEPWEDVAGDSMATNLIYAQITHGVLRHDYTFSEVRSHAQPYA